MTGNLSWTLRRITQLTDFLRFTGKPVITRKKEKQFHHFKFRQNSDAKKNRLSLSCLVLSEQITLNWTLIKNDLTNTLRPHQEVSSMDFDPPSFITRKIIIGMRQ